MRKSGGSMDRLIKAACLADRLAGRNVSSMEAREMKPHQWRIAAKALEMVEPSEGLKATAIGMLVAREVATRHWSEVLVMTAGR